MWGRTIQDIRRGDKENMKYKQIIKNVHVSMSFERHEWEIETSDWKSFWITLRLAIKERKRYAAKKKEIKDKAYKIMNNGDKPMFFRIKELMETEL